jgi:Nitrile hydratase, alpha chain
VRKPHGFAVHRRSDLQLAPAEIDAVGLAKLKSGQEAVNMGITRDIVAKATKDQAFRKRLLADPKAAIQQEFGVSLPADVKLQVHENSPSVVNLVIPGAEQLQRTLSAEELEQVSGGVMRRKTTAFVTLPCTDTMC